jgi:hypothetical protein
MSDFKVGKKFTAAFCSMLSAENDRLQIENHALERFNILLFGYIHESYHPELAMIWENLSEGKKIDEIIDDCFDDADSEFHDMPEEFAKVVRDNFDELVSESNENISGNESASN